MGGGSKSGAADRIGAALVPAALIVVGALLVWQAGGGGGLALQERRRLAPLPSLTYEAALDGRFAAAFDAFVGDHFPFRERLLDVAGWLRAHTGLPGGGGRFYPPRVEAPGGPAELEITAGWADAGPDEIARDAELEGVDAGAIDASVKKRQGPEPKLRVAQGILIYGERAMQMFGGSDKRARSYAALFQGLVDRLAPEVRVYSVVVPTAVSFYLPQAHRRRTRPEKPNLDLIGASLPPRVRHVEVYSVLERHRDEHLYFRTDHHWTALGAYYTYRAFCEAAGVKAVELGDMEHHSRDDFRGSMYGYTRDPVIGRQRERLEYWVPPVAYEATRRGFKHQRRAIKARFLSRRSRGYGVFLGADYPLLEARTERRNGRRVLLVKNSYGNPFAVFLLGSFEQVVVVDYRYFAGRLGALIRAHEITDLVVFNVSLTANSRNHQRRLKRLFKKIRRPKKPKPPKPVARAPRPAPPPEIAPAAPEITRDGLARVEAAARAFRAALIAGDARRLAPLYSPVLFRYRTRANVPRASMIRGKGRALHRYRLSALTRPKIRRRGDAYVSTFKVRRRPRRGEGPVVRLTYTLIWKIDPAAGPRVTAEYLGFAPEP